MFNIRGRKAGPRLYNTLTRRLERVRPLEAGHFKIYSCGPTVYRYIHIGNLRTFVMADWLRRALLYEGYRVTHVKNITDVGHMRIEMLDRGEDKLVAQARREGKTSAEIAAFYTQAFLHDEAALNILPADVFPRATQHVPEMIEIIAALLDRAIAYRAGGNVYFEVARFPAYGRLSGNRLAGMLAGARDEADPLKRSPEDFALWKAAEAGREMAWDSPWGRGFPGWHIECSAMSIRYLGRRFDIHTGGVDNIFPHHEDEIAQSEAWTGRPFVNCWVHAQHLLADGLKMSKSTGNTYTRTEVEARGFDPLALRYLFATAHYRSRINFTFGALQAAQTALNRLRDTALRLQAAGPESFKGDRREAREWERRFRWLINYDLSLPGALALVWTMLRRPAGELSPAARLRLLLEWDRVLGFGLAEHLANPPRHLLEPDAALAAAPQEVARLVKERAVARAAGNYLQADQLREQIRTMGYTLRDTKAGTLPVKRPPGDDWPAISRWTAAPDHLQQTDRYEFSVNLLSHNSRADLKRCIESVRRWAGQRSVEVVILDNGSTDDTLTYLRELARAGLNTTEGCPLGLQVLFADHNLGFAAGRNATFRASLGRYLVMLDTSIELAGDIWTPLERALEQPSTGVAGPYGLVTGDLREFFEPAGGSEVRPVDAVEGYLLAFRRATLPEVLPVDVKFRFYRMMDVYFCFQFKAAGYDVLAVPEVAGRLVRHPHREWHSLSEEERRTKSKQNYDLFRARWHHGQSLLAGNFDPARRWGHDDDGHLAGTHSHPPAELPPPGVPHVHRHQHWADHDHEHPHYHRL